MSDDMVVVDNTTNKHHVTEGVTQDDLIIDGGESSIVEESNPDSINIEIDDTSKVESKNEIVAPSNSRDLRKEEIITLQKEIILAQERKIRELSVTKLLMSEADESRESFEKMVVETPSLKNKENILNSEIATDTEQINSEKVDAASNFSRDSASLQIETRMNKTVKLSENTQMFDEDGNAFEDMEMDNKMRFSFTGICRRNSLTTLDCSPTPSTGKQSIPNSLSPIPPNVTSAKAAALLGDTRIAGNKVSKVLGDYTITAEDKRKMEREVIPIDLNYLQRYSMPEVDQAKKRRMYAKSLKLTGEVMLAGSKAEKLLGGPMTPDQINSQRKLDTGFLDPKKEVYLKQVYSAPDPGTSNSKVLRVFGETMLASSKANKILGSDETEDAKARRRASLVKDQEFTEAMMKLKKLYSAPDPGTTNAKAIRVLGEKMLASSKANKILGSDETEDAKARRRASLVKDQEFTEAMMKLKKLYSAPDPGTTNAKAIRVLGEKILASNKATKLLGTDVEADADAMRKATMASPQEFNESTVKRKMMYTAPEPGTTNSKAMRVLGEKTLAATKARKLLGTEDNQDDNVRRRASLTTDQETIQQLMELKKIYSAPDRGTANPKAIQILGDKLLAASKAHKILGPDETADIEARRKANQVIDSENNSDFMKSFKYASTPDGGVHNPKALQILGDKTLAATKAHQILGTEDNQDDNVRRRASLTTDQETIQQLMELKKIYSAPDRGTANPKAIQILGDKLLAASKAHKILGPDETADIEARRKANQVIDSENNSDFMKSFKYASTPDGGVHNPKALQILGDKTLAATKAHRILGTEDNQDDNVRRRASLTTDQETIQQLMELKKVYSAPDRGTANPKAIQILGDKLLAASKAHKILGPDETADIEARRKANQVIDSENNSDFMKSFKYASTPDGGVHNPKALQILGDKTLAATKAHRILGTEDNQDDNVRRRASLTTDQETIQQLMELKKIYSAPDRGTANPKAIQILGDKLLAASKAHKILGPDETADIEARRKANQVVNSDFNSEAIRLKQIVTAPDPGTANPKAMKILGDKALAASKAHKILGNDNAQDSLAREKASRVKDPKISIDMMKRMTLPNKDKYKSKVYALTGETMLAGLKAERILGGPMTRKQQVALRKNEKQRGGPLSRFTRGRHKNVKNIKSKSSSPPSEDASSKSKSDRAASVAVFRRRSSMSGSLSDLRAAVKNAESSKRR